MESNIRKYVFLLVCNHLEIRNVVFLYLTMSLLGLQIEQVLFLRLRHVSTGAQI